METVGRVTPEEGKAWKIDGGVAPAKFLHRKPSRGQFRNKVLERFDGFETMGGRSWRLIEESARCSKRYPKGILASSLSVCLAAFRFLFSFLAWYLLCEVRVWTGEFLVRTLYTAIELRKKKKIILRVGCWIRLQANNILDVFICKWYTTCYIGLNRNKLRGVTNSLDTLWNFCRSVVGYYRRSLIIYSCSCCVFCCICLWLLLQMACSVKKYV